MVHIIKKPEPTALLQAKKRGLKDYNDMETPVKDAVKDQLFLEQKGLCSYCMRRLERETMQIEHYIPQHGPDGSENTLLSVDYHNMLGVCPGGKGQAARGHADMTCDQHRGNTLLTVDPLNLHSIKKIRYRSDGTIFSNDPIINSDLNDVLNLNCKAAKLPMNRKAVLDQFFIKLKSKYPNKSISKRNWEKMLEHYQNSDPLIPFVGIIIEFIYRKIASTQ